MEPNTPRELKKSKVKRLCDKSAYTTDLFRNDNVDGGGDDDRQIIGFYSHPVSGMPMMKKMTMVMTDNDGSDRDDYVAATAAVFLLLMRVLIIMTLKKTMRVVAIMMLMMIVTDNDDGCGGDNDDFFC